MHVQAKTVSSFLSNSCIVPMDHMMWRLQPLISAIDSGNFSTLL